MNGGGKLALTGGFGGVGGESRQDGLWNHREETSEV